ncbi:MAG: phosphopantetheine-binding protein [Pirellulaceae bacterium]
MGLDGVELVMDVEDHFGITIKDSEAEQIRTVGDLVALIRSRIEAATTQACPMMLAFLMLRQVVRDIVNDEAFRMRPRDRLATLLSPHHRRQLWHRLPDILGTLPRSLRRPQLLRMILVSSSILLLLAATAFAASDWHILPLTLFLAIALIFLLWFATAPYCTMPPTGWVTMGDIAHRIVGTTVATTNLVLDDDEAVLRELRPIIIDTLGVDATEIVTTARFIEDLGMG